MALITRSDGRAFDELRPVSMETNIAPHAAGSVLIRFGRTQVICAACLEAKVPPWMQKEEPRRGWITAEYSMLPYSTLERKPRDSSRGKADGRTIEIQRLIGRSLRATADLTKIPGYSLWLDCDVLQADGGTRTASITGAYVAAQIAVRNAIREEKLTENPFTDSVAAISAGIVNSAACLDLNYEEDFAAAVDANIVMTGSGSFVEIQSTGEEATFSSAELAAILELAQKGIHELTRIQNRAIAEATVG